MKKKTGRRPRPQAPGSIDIQRLDIPKASPRWPHAVTMNLTDAQYQEFKKDPLAFDNNYSVYPGNPMIHIVSYVEIPISAACKPAGNWTVIILHGKPSNGGVVACQQHV